MFNELTVMPDQVQPIPSTTYLTVKANWQRTGSTDNSQRFRVRFYYLNGNVINGTWINIATSGY